MSMKRMGSTYGEGQTKRRTDPEEVIAKYARQAAAEFHYGTNMRGSAGYRNHLAEVLIRREMSSILAEGR